MTPYYEHAGITIYHGDYRTLLPQIDSTRIGVLIADPPYGVNSQRGDGRIGGAVYGDTSEFDPSPLLAMGCATVLFGANVYAHRLPPSRGWLVWDKTFPDCAEQSQCELAWTNFVRGIRVHREAYHGFMRQRDGWLHPMQKPPKLFRWILGLRWTPPGLVLDPCMGAGPAILAAKELGRPAVGIEIEERYCEIAAKRLAQEVLPFHALTETRASA